MSKPRITLVVNPASNKGAAAQVGSLIANHLRSAADIQLRSGSSAAESMRLLTQAAEESDAVLVCGGDGIVHLAVNALAEGDTPLGIVPAGTGNDTASVLGISADPQTAADSMLAALAEGSIRRIDLGHCDSLSISAAGSGRWWAAMLYGGFDSAVNERANAMRWPKGRRRYDLAILAELARLKPRAISLTLDGQRLDLDVTLVAIGNGPQYGGGKRMAPDARMDDGIFDITVIGPVSRFKLARLAPTLPHAGHIGHREVSQYRAREVTFAAVNTMAYADGELLGPLPLTTRCVSRALPVLIPLGSMPPGLSMVQTSQNG